ncbi:MAG TPA: hypothetical protein VFB12_28265 [Ktedonobacteraceae bacterium]|nr:hypothetical protein [Ktedonobacteraceae bacterium]
MRKRSSLLRPLIIALLAWAALLTFTYFMWPPTIWVFVAFFVMLAVALISTLSLLIYIIGRNVFSLPLYQTMRPAVRQSTLLSLVVIFNLLLRALNSWNIIMAIVIFIAAVILEILALARK